MAAGNAHPLAKKLAIRFSMLIPVIIGILILRYRFTADLTVAKQFLMVFLAAVFFIGAIAGCVYTMERHMRTYVTKRLLLMVPTLFGVTLVVFTLTRFVPGGPMDQAKMQMMGGGMGGEAGGGRGIRASGATISDKDMQYLNEFYGFDKPLQIQYANYLFQLLRFDMGLSTRYRESASGLIAERFPISLYYGLITTILTYVICIPLGILKAIKHNSHLDNFSSMLIFVGYAVPNFALGAVLLVLLSVKYDIFPLGGFVSSDFSSMTFFEKAKDLMWHSILPLICYMINSLAFMTILMKNSLIENMSADFVKTALAKGMTWRRAVFVHALRNSLIPLATSFGGNIGILLAGSLLIERVFQIPGMGLLFFESLTQRDYPILMGIVVIGAILTLVGNLLSDLCVAAVDPRVRFT